MHDQWAVCAVRVVGEMGPAVALDPARSFVDAVVPCSAGQPFQSDAMPCQSDWPMSHGMSIKRSFNWRRLGADDDGTGHGVRGGVRQAEVDFEHSAVGGGGGGGAV